MTALAFASRGVVRLAEAADDAALVTLAAACPMEGTITLVQRRGPCFFALSRIEGLGGPPASVLVVDGPDGRPVGCISVAERLVHLHGRPRKTAYISDLKVHPAHRGQGVADALVEAAREHVRAQLGPDCPSVLTILAGNVAMAKRLSGPRGLPRLERFATLDAVSIPFLPRGARVDPALELSPARLSDLPEMLALHAQVARGRQFAPVLDEDRFRQFLIEAPGLRLSDYLLARRRTDHRLLGFLALWDQRSFKQSVVLRWGLGLGAFRLVWNATAPLLRVPRLPPAGAPLQQLAGLHVTVPSDRPDVLRALVLAAHDLRRPEGHAFFTVALDQRDPLRPALAGLWGQTTRVWACVSAPRGGYVGPALDDRPLHFETALV